jgi:hypothetical protein
MISCEDLIKFMAASTLFVIWATWIAAPVLIIIYVIIASILQSILGL